MPFCPPALVLLMKDFWIAPSILSADFARLGEEVDKVLAAGADVVHFDVMDNHYVPNLTIGPMVCKALRNYGVTAPIDVHLMVKPVDRIIGDFIEAGASFITFHPEASEHIDRSLQLIRSAGLKAGLVLNPATSPECLKYVMDKLDMVLLEDAPYNQKGFEAGETEAPSVVVMVAANSRFPKRQPEFTEFLKKYHTSSALTAEALAYIADNKAGYEQAARWFLQKHDNLLAEWLPQDKADAVRVALKENKGADI